MDQIRPMIEDQVTGQDHSVTRIVLGAWRDHEGQTHVLRDWEVLQMLNTLGRADNPKPPSVNGEQLKALEVSLLSSMKASLPTIAEMMTRPGIRSEIMLLPDENAGT